MINGMTLILKWLIFHFLMEMFLAPLHMVYTFRNVFVLHEYVLMMMTSTIEKKLTSKLQKRGYRFHKLCKVFFLNFITDIQS